MQTSSGGMTSPLGERNRNMLDRDKFADAMRKLYLLFDRQPNLEQVKEFYEKLKFNNSEYLTKVVDMLAENNKKFPGIADWVQAFKSLKSSSEAGKTVLPYHYQHRCPKCGTKEINARGGSVTDTSGVVLPDITYAECLNKNCSYREIYRDYLKTVEVKA